MGQGTVIERDVREIHFSMFFFFLLMVNCSCCNYIVYVFYIFFSRAFHEFWRSLACGAMAFSV